MAEYAFRGIEVSLRSETRHVPVGVDHACVGQNLWMAAINDKGYLYKCGGKLCGQPEFAYATAREWDPAYPFATASNPDMLSKFLNNLHARSRRQVLRVRVASPVRRRLPAAAPVRQAQVPAVPLRSRRIRAGQVRPDACEIRRGTGCCLMAKREDDMSIYTRRSVLAGCATLAAAVLSGCTRERTADYYAAFGGDANSNASGPSCAYRCPPEAWSVGTAMART